MIATINLIPPKIKKEYASRQIMSVIVLAMVGAVIMTLIVWGAFLMVNFYAGMNLDQIKLSLSEEELKIKSLSYLEDDVNAINTKLEKINKLHQENLDFEAMLNAFNTSVPDMVKIDTLTLNQKSYSLTLSGSAETRRDIVKLQEKLNSLEHFDKVSFSSSSYSTSSEMYTFNMVGEITHE